MLTIQGKHFLITSGQCKEKVDSVRFFTNTLRPKNFGESFAKVLKAKGANITCISTNDIIVSAQDLLNACINQLNDVSIDGIIHLASVSSIKPRTAHDKKLKIKSNKTELFSLDVVNNMNVIAELHHRFPNQFICGLTPQQTLLCDDADLKSLILHHTAIENTLPINDSWIHENRLRNKKIIVTSGATVEPITTTQDVLTNFSSGKQGHAIACALAAMGADVILISGPTNLHVPKNLAITEIPVTTANEMKQACFQHLPADVFIAVAAVADFSLTTSNPYTLSFSQNPDILAEIGHHPTLRPRIVIGFAAETHDLISYAKNKLTTKNADVICANEVGIMTTNNNDQNKIYYITQDQIEEWPLMNKTDIGFTLGKKIVVLLK